MGGPHRLERDRAGHHLHGVTMEPRGSVPFSIFVALAVRLSLQWGECGGRLTPSSRERESSRGQGPIVLNCMAASSVPSMCACTRLGS